MHQRLVIIWFVGAVLLLAAAQPGLISPNEARAQAALPLGRLGVVPVPEPPNLAEFVGNQVVDWPNAGRQALARQLFESIDRSAFAA